MYEEINGFGAKNIFIEEQHKDLLLRLEILPVAKLALHHWLRRKQL